MLLAGRRGARPRDVPRAGASARHARPARGVPERRRAGVRRRVRGGPDTESLHALQRVVPLRRARRVRRAGGRGRPLDRPLRAPRGAGRDAPRRARRGSREGPVVHARDDRSCALRPRRLPARRDVTKAAVRDEAAAAGLAAARRPESQEACFLAGGDYRAFLERHGVASTPGSIVDETGTRPWVPRRALEVHAGPAARARRRLDGAAPRPALRSTHATPSSSGRAARSARAA